MTVTVQTADNAVIRTTPAEMAGLSGSRFAAADRMPGLSGEAFDFAAWYAALTADKDTALAQPTHLTVRAADEFEAAVPWNELDGAFFLLAPGGAPPNQTDSLRLYVPDGSSACLNVKNVQYIRISSDPLWGGKAVYGFRNEISPARISQSFKNRGSSEAAGTAEG